MKTAIDSQYRCFNARTTHLISTETLIAINSLGIHRVLEFNKDLGESVGEFKKSELGAVDDC